MGLINRCIGLGVAGSEWRLFLKELAKRSKGFEENKKKYVSMKQPIFPLQNV